MRDLSVHGGKDIVRGFLGYCAPKMEAVRSPERLVSNHHNTRRNSPENNKI